MGLSRQVAIVAAGRLATASSIFVVNALLARAWSLPDFGRFSAVWILGNTLAPVFLLGVPTALLYAFPRRAPGHDRRLLVWQSTAVLCVSACLLVGLLWWAGGPLSGWRSSSVLADLLLPFPPSVFREGAPGPVGRAPVPGGRSRGPDHRSTPGGGIPNCVITFFASLTASSCFAERIGPARAIISVSSASFAATFAVS